MKVNFRPEFKLSALSLVTPVFTALVAAAMPGSAWSSSTAPDISVQLSGPVELLLGRPDHYRLMVTNIGSAAASSVTARMTFPPGVALDTRLNTATGRQDLKIPKNCSYTSVPAPQLTCQANNVLIGETRTFLIDMRAPLNGPSVGSFSWTATVPGDLNTTNNTATHYTLFDSFNPVGNLSFPTSMALWVAMGKKSVLENPMTGNPYRMAMDGNGAGSGLWGVAVTWQATVVGSGLNIQINSAMYQPAVDMNLTPFSSRCFQGMGYWTGLRDSYEVRVCF